MSVNNLKARDDWTRNEFGGRAPACFYCGETITDIAIIWQGHASDGANLGLICCHPQCATDLGAELLADSRNAQRLLIGKPLTAGVDASLLP